MRAVHLLAQRVAWRLAVEAIDGADSGLNDAELMPFTSLSTCRPRG
jgi:hypothetical protein